MKKSGLEKTIVAHEILCRNPLECHVFFEWSIQKTGNAIKKLNTNLKRRQGVNILPSNVTDCKKMPQIIRTAS